MIRYLTAGESHGPALTGIVEGLPAGVTILEDDITFHLSRRQQGYGRGGRMAFEKDVVKISSGVRFGKSIGGPIALTIQNRAFEKDGDNWPLKMSIEPIKSEVAPITLARPGHADLVGALKYGFSDIRPVIDRSSARETAMRVACCSIARLFLKQLGIQIGGHVTRIGNVGYQSWETTREIIDPLVKIGAESLIHQSDRSEVRCVDTTLTEQMVDEIKKYRKQGSSLGGHFEIIITGTPLGLGSYTHWDKKLDGQLAQAIMSTQAMKGVEIGYGFESGYQPGHLVHDEITHDGDIFRRSTNRAGGIEGGMSTGEPIIIRGCMKPIPTMLNALGTVDLITKQPQKTRYERSDICALPRAIVVLESVVAPVIANAILEKFGGDSLIELQKRLPT